MQSELAAVAEFENKDWVQDILKSSLETHESKKFADPNIAFPFHYDFSFGIIHGTNVVRMWHPVRQEMRPLPTQKVQPRSSKRIKTTIRGSSTRVPAICFFPGRNNSLRSLSKSKSKQTDEQQRERQFLTRHINRSTALANYRTPMNHIYQLHQCQLPLNHNLATVRAC
jgi:hypothetical protein